MNDDLWATVRVHPWKWRRRSRQIRLIIIHSTRSGQPYTTGQEYRATMNWFSSPTNKQFGSGETYAAMASRIVGDQGRLCAVMPDDVYPAYSAGHMDPIAKSYEITQPTNDTPYNKADLERLAQEVAIDCKQYKIPPIALPFVSGDNHEAPGIAFHDRSANGNIYGKTDPGKMFDRQGFAARVAELMEEEDMAERVWASDTAQTWVIGKNGAAPVLYPAMDEPFLAIYGKHTKAMTSAQLEAIRTKD